jgi:hypothetical protein
MISGWGFADGSGRGLPGACALAVQAEKAASSTAKHDRRGEAADIRT